MGEKCGCYISPGFVLYDLDFKIIYCPLHQAARELLRAAEKALPYVEDHKKHRFLSDMIKEAKAGEGRR